MATAVAAAAAAPTAYPPSACDCAWTAPPTACDGGDDGSICWRECCIRRRAPRAHLITDGGERGNRSEALLRRLGFDVRLVRPIAAARDTLDARLLSQRRTQQAILATIAPSPARAFEYIFEDDIALHRTVPEASLMPLVRAAESHALTSSAPLLYLGSCKTYDTAGATAQLVVDGANAGLSKCAVLCTHAVGVRTSAASSLVAAVRTALGARWSVAMDQNLFRWTRKQPPERWPSCVGGAKQVPAPKCCRGLFYQDRKAFASTIKVR